MTIEYEIYAVSKPTKLISRKNNIKEWFKDTGIIQAYDIIHKIRIFNKKQYVSYLQDLNIGF